MKFLGGTAVVNITDSSPPSKWGETTVWIEGDYSGQCRERLGTTIGGTHVYMPKTRTAKKRGVLGMFQPYQHDI